MHLLAVCVVNQVHTTTYVGKINVFFFFAENFLL